MVEFHIEESAEQISVGVHRTDQEQDTNASHGTNDSSALNWYDKDKKKCWKDARIWKHRTDYYLFHDNDVSKQLHWEMMKMEQV